MSAGKDSVRWEHQLVRTVGAVVLVLIPGLLVEVAVTNPGALGISAAGIAVLARTGWRLLVKPEDPWQWFS
jgi:hypothetical protein